MVNQMNLMEAFKITSLTKYGIIRAIYDTHNPLADPPEIPFLPSEEVAKRIDNFYYFGWSGDKIISPMLEKLYHPTAASPLDEYELARMFWDIYGDQLMKQWENFTREYDPINDYDITEITGYGHTGSSSGTDGNTRTGQVETSANVEDTDYAWSYDQTGIEQERPVSKSITANGTPENPNIMKYNDVHDARTRSSSETATDNLNTHKFGNLGVQSVSLLLKQDIELWKMNFYRNIFFPALDSFLAIPIY